MEHTNIDPADLDSPHQELPVRGLTFVVAFSVCWKIDVVCASKYCGSNPAVHI